MAPRGTKNTANKCEVCTITKAKYTCSGCLIPYCSVPCYKQHKAAACSGSQPIEQTPTLDVEPTTTPLPLQEPTPPPLTEQKPLRSLASLNWPYAPEESAYPDPLKRDDPKQLQTAQCEAIATSANIRRTLATYPQLPKLLTSIDKLRGPDRENALQHALGVTAPQISASDPAARAPLSEDVLALRALAEAIEGAVRGGQQQLGLDWGE